MFCVCVTLALKYSTAIRSEYRVLTGSCLSLSPGCDGAVRLLGQQPGTAEYSFPSLSSQHESLGRGDAEASLRTGVTSPLWPPACNS